jgi:hypothetical protein
MGQLQDQVSNTHQAAETISHDLMLLRREVQNTHKTPCNETKSLGRCCIESQRKSTGVRVKQSIEFRSYIGLIGKLLIRKASQSATICSSISQSTPEIYSTNITSWAFIPSFLSYGFEYQSFSSSGSIQRSLRTYPLISHRHPVWKMCSSGDLKGMQTLLSGRQVSPFSVDTDGLTLLHVC